MIPQYSTAVNEGTGLPSNCIRYVCIRQDIQQYKINIHIYQATFHLSGNSVIRSASKNLVHNAINLLWNHSFCSFI